MSRPRKNTIDYFPHPVKDGSRMYIMEQKYGDKGYCCYYKLLQQLGGAENHFLDFTGIKDRLYFAALIRSTEEEVNEMLTTLAEIGTIDKDLWAEKKIWCQELVDSISEVYVKRRRELPKKPSFCVENTQSATVSVSQNPQSKVKESKVKESSYSKTALIDIYFNDLPNSQYLEDVCRINEIKKESLLAYLPEFKKRARAEYKNFNEFVDHFKYAYLKKELENSQKQAPIVVDSSFKPPRKP